MTIFERIMELIKIWRMNHYGNYPNRIFLGNEEYEEVKQSMDLVIYSNICLEKQEKRIFGVIVEVVYKEHYLSVGEIIEG